MVRFLVPLLMCTIYRSVQYAPAARAIKNGPIIESRAV